MSPAVDHAGFAYCVALMSYLQEDDRDRVAGFSDENNVQECSVGSMDERILHRDAYVRLAWPHLK
jgi:hypothetical protein